MLEITNKNKSPIQIIILSKKGAYNKRTNKCADVPYSMSYKNIPGIGSGNNVILIEDERKTEYIDRQVAAGLLSIKHVTKHFVKDDK